MAIIVWRPRAVVGWRRSRQKCVSARAKTRYATQRGWGPRSEASPPKKPPRTSGDEASAAGARSTDLPDFREGTAGEVQRKPFSTSGVGFFNGRGTRSVSMKRIAYLLLPPASLKEGHNPFHQALGSTLFDASGWAQNTPHAIKRTGPRTLYLLQRNRKAEV
jgi:hypothetical protein